MVNATRLLPFSKQLLTILWIVKLSPLLRFELEDTCCWSLDWGNSEVIAAGCTNGKRLLYVTPGSIAEMIISGAIAVYNVKNALEIRLSNPSTRKLYHLDVLQRIHLRY